MTALSDQEVAAYSRILFFGPITRRDEALVALIARGKLDVAPTLILALRYRGQDPTIKEALEDLSERKFLGWKEAMIWREEQAGPAAHPSFKAIKLQVMEDIDPGFLELLDRPLTIRLEEIVWGGAYIESIPALERPKTIAARDADYLLPDDLVFGVTIDGVARAYPLRILGWHEMVNDVIAGKSVSLAYCPLCGSAILYKGEVEGLEEPLTFGSSGLLYRSNKLMIDRQTRSLWHQLTGRPVAGPLLAKNIELSWLPIVTARWADWKARHPQTTVLALDTGYSRDYGSGVVYADYLASRDLMFPAALSDGGALESKDFVFGLTAFGQARAWPLKAFRQSPVINDQFDGENIVLIGDAGGRSVRAYSRSAEKFRVGPDHQTLESGGRSWQITEEALLGPAGERFLRKPGKVTYWFAWNSHLNIESSLYKP